MHRHRQRYHNCFTAGEHAATRQSNRFTTLGKNVPTARNLERKVLFLRISIFGVYGSLSATTGGNKLVLDGRLF